jgi:hypothetical protein
VKWLLRQKLVKRKKEEKQMKAKRNRKNMKLSIVDSQTNGEEEMARV